MSERIIYMKYFIGIRIPNKYKMKIEVLRAEFRFFTTEPHITIVPPIALPDDDSFIKGVANVCKKTQSFNVQLGELGQFGNRVLYVGVNSPELKVLHDNLYEELCIEREKRDFTPHLTIVKQRLRRPVDIESIKIEAQKKLTAPPMSLS